MLVFATGAQDGVLAESKLVDEKAYIKLEIKGNPIESSWEQIGDYVTEDFF